jgi:hypothetical protein
VSDDKDEDKWKDRRKRPPGSGDPLGSDQFLPVPYQVFSQRCGPSDEDRERYALETPCVLDEERCMSILHMIADGNYLETACTAAGITKRIFYHWKRKVKRGDEDAIKVRWFFDQIPQAKAMAEVVVVSKMNSCKSSEWFKYAWRLERCYGVNPWGKERGRRWQRPELQVDDGADALEPPKPLEKMSEEEIAYFKEEVLENGKKSKRGRK